MEPKKEELTGKLTLDDILENEPKVSYPLFVGILVNGGKLKELNQQLKKKSEGKDLDKIMTLAEFRKLKKNFLEKEI